jgi:RNA recognition motif-containing protein
VPGQADPGRIEKIQVGKKLYVGNIPFSITETELRELFEEHGSIESINVITDRDTGRPRGFAFVEMEDSGSADAAMQALDGREIGGRALRVNEAHERGRRPGGGGGGGGGGGFGRGGGGGGGRRGR